MIYQHYLVSPLDDDPLNIVLHGAIHLPTIALPHLGSHRKLLVQTSPAERCDLRFGSKRTEKFEITRGAAECDFKFSVRFGKFPCALKAKSQITPLRRVMFAINTTTTSRSVL